MEVHPYTFANGLVVYAVPHRRAPVVAIVVLYRVGSQEEMPEQAGLAHLVEHLAFGSSAYLEREEFDRYCSDAGGTNNAMTSYSYTLYMMVLPAYQLPLGLWLEASRLRALTFTDEEFTTQQSVIIEELKETVYNQPYGRWRDIQARSAFAPGCPYHWEVHGSLETVAALQVEAARVFARRYYRPDNAIVVVCGDVEPQQVYELAQEYLAPIPAPMEPIARPQWSAACRQGGVHTQVADHVPLAAVFLSFHGGGYTAPEFLALQAIADVLGGGRSSRLYRTLLLQRALASDAGAFLDSRQWSSLVTLYAFAAAPDVSPRQLQDALWEQVRCLCRDGISAEELTTTRNRLQTAYAFLVQHPLGVAQEVALSAAFWNDPERPFRIVAEYDRLTAEEITECARSVLVPDNAVATVVVPQP